MLRSGWTARSGTCRRAAVCMSLSTDERSSVGQLPHLYRRGVTPSAEIKFVATGTGPRNGGRIQGRECVSLFFVNTPSWRSAKRGRVQQLEVVSWERQPRARAVHLTRWGSIQIAWAPIGFPVSGIATSIFRILTPSTPTFTGWLSSRVLTGRDCQSRLPSP